MKVRRLLGDDASEPALVRTVHRVGYRFAGEVVAAAKVGAASASFDAHACTNAGRRASFRQPLRQ